MAMMISLKAFKLVLMVSYVVNSLKSYFLCVSWHSLLECLLSYIKSAEVLSLIMIIAELVSYLDIVCLIGIGFFSQYQFATYFIFVMLKNNDQNNKT